MAMKILVNQDDQKLGPLLPDELRELVYQGSIQRTAMARVDGEPEWVSVDTLLRRPESPSAVPVPPKVVIPIEQLRDPKERKALICLWLAAVPAWLLLVAWTVTGFGVPLVIIGAVLLTRLIAECWFTAYLRTNAIRVSATQLPELHRIVVSSCERLGLEPAEVYVMQENVWNAFASRILGRNLIVLLSGAVDSILLKGDYAQLAWLVGHELGHHRAGHLLLSRKLASLGNWCVWVRLWYSRRCELTSDRIALYCAGNLQPSQRALVNATVGAQLANQVNVKEAIQQWEQHQGEFFVKYRTLYASHPHLLARLKHLWTAASEFGLPG
jgi:Zn-dependent protease with chaperone function